MGNGNNGKSLGNESGATSLLKAKARDHLDEDDLEIRGEMQHLESLDSLEEITGQDFGGMHEEKSEETLK